MIKITSKNGVVDCTVDGTLPVLAADTICAIKGIYNGINKDDKEAGKRFKNIIIEQINRAFDDDDEPKTKTASALKVLTDILKEIKGSMEYYED